ncbi:hypothetical protein WJX72_004519 [[Myrmecia] bisecta]|uniref:Uncharacterized protein n=1 Tax=[Myrmecia] bisecta TaxID=41462 RepID=A0AAW1PDS3_9CHLO
MGLGKLGRPKYEDRTNHLRSFLAELCTTVDQLVQEQPPEGETEGSRSTAASDACDADNVDADVNSWPEATESADQPLAEASTGIDFVHSMEQASALQDASIKPWLLSPNLVTARKLAEVGLGVIARMLSSYPSLDQAAECDGNASDRDFWEAWSKSLKEVLEACEQPAAS